MPPGWSRGAGSGPRPSVGSAFTPRRRSRPHRIPVEPDLEREGVRAETGRFLGRFAKVLPRQGTHVAGRPDIGWSSSVDSPHAFGDRSVCGHAAVVEIVFIVEEAAEGGFTARAVGESIFTEGDTLESVRANVRDAVECHFEEGHIPKIIRLHFVRDEILSP